MTFNLVGKAVKVLRLPTVSYNNAPITVVPAQEGDVNSRFLNVTMYDDRGDIDLSQYTNATLNVTLPNGSVEFTEAKIDAENNSVICKIAGTMLGQVGRVSCDVSVIGEEGDGKPVNLTSQTFYIIVSRSQNGDDAIEGDDDYTLLVQLLRDVAKLESDTKAAEEARASAETQRISAEEIRVASENERKAAEEIRKSFATVGISYNATTGELRAQKSDEKNPTQTADLSSLREGNLTDAKLINNADGTATFRLIVKKADNSTRNIDVTMDVSGGNVDVDINVENGEGEYSVVQKSKPDGTENRAMSPNSIALGDGSMAGRYAFFIEAIDTLNKYIYLSTTKNESPTIGEGVAGTIDTTFYFSDYRNSGNSQIGIGCYFSIIAHNHYHNLGPITRVHHNRITYFGDLPFDTLEEDTGEDGYSFFSPNAPTCGSKLLGGCAIAEGGTAHAYGASSTAMGFETRTIGDYGHAEGIRTKAYYAGHAEGHATVALGNHAHAEGNYSEADGNASHAEGDFSKAKGHISHAEGGATTAAGEYSHAQNYKSYAGSRSSHAEGERSFAGVNVESIAPESLTFEYTATTIDEKDAVIVRFKVNGSALDPHYVLPFRIDAGLEGARATYGIGGLYAIDETSGKNYLGLIMEECTLDDLANPVLHTFGLPVYYINRLEPTEKDAAHTEGHNCVAGDKYAHAEGGESMALGQRSHAEGSRTKAVGMGSHTEGVHTYTGPDAPFSHAEGGETRALAQRAHAEGTETIASGGSSHAEGSGTKASAESAHSEGNKTEASANYSHAEGWHSAAQNTAAHSEGGKTKATGSYAHAEGSSSMDNSGNVTKQLLAQGSSSHAEGQGTQALSAADHAEGGETTAKGGRSHAEGTGTTASGWAAHAEGNGTISGGTASHAEGTSCKATGAQDHAEGANTTASGGQSHAEGSNTNALGWASHSEGLESKAEGWASHAEGRGTSTSAGNWTSGGSMAHAEGYNTKAMHPASHAEGEGTRTSKRAQHVEGAYNADEATAYHITGCGTSDSVRENCFTAGVSGTEKYIKIGNTFLTETLLMQLIQNIGNTVTLEGADFYIGGGRPCKFIVGMTWQLYCETVGYMEGSFYTYGDNACYQGGVIAFEGEPVKLTDVIVAERTYETIAM